MKTQNLKITIHSPLSPGHDNHIKMVVENYLRSKGIKTHQEYDEEGKPLHRVVIETV